MAAKGAFIQSNLLLVVYFDLRCEDTFKCGKFDRVIDKSCPRVSGLPGL